MLHLMKESLQRKLAALFFVPLLTYVGAMWAVQNSNRAITFSLPLGKLHFHDIIRWIVCKMDRMSCFRRKEPERLDRLNPIPQFQLDKVLA